MKIAIAAPKMDVKTIEVNGQPVKVEVARTDEQQQFGLMLRKHLDENAGMLFEYYEDVVVCMWMKNTLIPLSAAFIRADGTIANIAARMEPLTLTRHCGKGAVRYVLETNAGWFEKHGIKPGDKVTGL